MVHIKRVPELVERALQVASQHGFSSSCLDEVGRFLQILGGFKSGAKVAEIGTGFGVGSAWILSGMDADSTLFTVESDPDRVSAVREMFSGIENVRIIAGDWKLILRYAPFDYVFVDAKPAKYDEADLVIRSVNLNGFIVLDDFTPMEHWPDEWKGTQDLVRDKWFNDDRLLCMELRTSEKNSILLARRVK
ncbi:MAG: class I SAM-dependent methyltransferase [Alicyclobacillus macrosporangiidus]|uniref:O-methyltransferase n=1 Tax=Alicyclobacillus macrosporangiidus TaxID=392015 RepID=UPI0026EE233A|nr:class I SAM-dependent methyltransferase [Alicyclobacillus macrosporangiidus]MCL6600438.1 class I SAM-dependent methyltransferase [Alicyclobacillus macrosporangiidus]